MQKEHKQNSPIPMKTRRALFFLFSFLVLVFITTYTLTTLEAMQHKELASELKQKVKSMQATNAKLRQEIVTKEALIEEKKNKLEQKQKEIEHKDVELKKAQQMSLKKRGNKVTIASVSARNGKTVQQSEGAYMTVEATAYTADCRGCTGITATGVDVRSGRHNVIAVDPRIIPLRRQVEIIVGGESWGVWRTEDTGGDIKGHRIDILMGSEKEALNFGRRDVVVKLLPKNIAR